MKKLMMVVTYVEVEVDENKFTPEFISDYKKDFYDFNSIEDHMGHIAQLEARDLLMPFTEGYGPITEFGIKASVEDVVIHAEE